LSCLSRCSLERSGSRPDLHSFPTRRSSDLLRTTETLLLNNRVRHGDHKVLTMCAGNAVVKKDDAGNRKLTKAGSRGRIDGMISRSEEHTSELQSRENLVCRLLLEKKKHKKR